jgi:hypothetical protein
LEQVLNDVVRVDLVPASACDLAVPFNVGGLTETTGVKQVEGETVSRIGDALLSLAYNVQDGDDGEIESAPTLKQTDKQQAAGIIVTHDLQVPITSGFQATSEAVSLLLGIDFHIVLTTSEGTCYLCYSLPNTSSVLLEEQGVDQSTTVKVTLQSMSNVIKLLS